jgi:CRISPR system Cascade subunit CasC
MFIQLHLLTSYPPSNLNRDDLGRPKSAVMGNVPRLRVSSQSLKRAWRTSAIFAEQLDGALSLRTRRLARQAHETLLARGVEADLAAKAAEAIGGAVYDKVDPKAKFDAGQLAFIGPTEQAAMEALIETVVTTGALPDEKAVKAMIGAAHGGADIALFGRMLASRPHDNVEAAADVAHAITVHKAVIEDDFFTAVDDLQSRAEEDEAGAGAGFMGETGFGAGLYYLYICVNERLLTENLGGESALAATAVRALVEAATRVGPSGKKTSFGSHAHALYALAERGTASPRGLSTAFLSPVDDRADMIGATVTALETTALRMDKAYGKTAEDRYRMNVLGSEGTLAGLMDFAGGTAVGNWTPADTAA